MTSGATIILVSHNSDAVVDTCQRAIWLDKGKIRMDGSAATVVEEYGKFIDG